MTTRAMPKDETFRFRVDAETLEMVRELADWEDGGAGVPVAQLIRRLIREAHAKAKPSATPKR